MSAVRDYILTVDRDPDSAAKNVEELSSALQSRQTPLVELVQSLGEYINNEDATIRAKAVKLLAQVVASLPSQFLSRQQILVLCDFLCDRIEDGNALSGLETLARLPRFTREMAVSTFRALCVHYPELKSMPQSVRYDALVLLSTVMRLHRPALRELGLESLSGVLDLVAGERDPRNLMVVFAFMSILISEWDISSRVEDVFDAVFCYFPITFRPPPNDPYGITAKDLKDRLESCVSASDLFAPFVFPQLIDKLDSSAINAKKDVLRAVAACSKSYDKSTLAGYSTTIWDAFKFEIFNAQEEELADEAISSLASLANSLGKSLAVHTSDSDLTTYLSAVAKECNERLREPQQKQAQPAARIVGTLAATSAQALEFLVHACLPPLLKLYQEAENFEMRRAILSAVLVLIQASAESGFRFTAESPPLARFKDSLSDLLLQAIVHKGGTETSFRSVAMESITKLCICPGVLDAGEVNLVATHLCEIVIEEDTASMELRRLAIDSISTLSASASDLVTTVVLPKIFSQLPDSGTNTNQTYRLLNALASLKLDAGLSGTLIRRLMNKATPVFQESGPSEYFCAIIATVNSILLCHKLANDALLTFCTERIISLTSTLLDKHSNQSADTGPVWFNASLMIGRLTCVVFRLIDVNAQRETSQQLFILLDAGIQAGSEGLNGITAESAGARAILRTHVFAGCKASVPLPYSQQDLLALMDSAIAHSQTSTDAVVRHTLLEQVALLANKFIIASELHQVEERLWSESRGVLSHTNLSRSSIRTGIWIAKGLALRLSKVTEVVTKLIDLLSNEQHGADVALAFELILSPDEILSKANDATIRLLSPQKIFSQYLAETSKRLHSASIGEKSNYLTALAGLLKYLDSGLVMMQGEPLLPLLSQALSLDNPKVKESAIKTLTVLVEGSAESLESHAPDLVNRLLASASNLSPSMVQVRHFALVALRHFAVKVNRTTLIPYRQAVLNGIRPCLDDPKRFVRKDAVDCRSAWVDLDDPETEGS